MKHSNKRNIILVLLLLGIFNFIYVDNVFAADDIVKGIVTGYNGVNGKPNTGNYCTKNLCYSTNTGIRITLVNKNGERCHLNGNNLCASSGTEAISVDYWYSAKDMLDFSGTCYAYNTKRMKSEFVNNKNLNGLQKCTDVYSKYYDLESLGFPPVPISDKNNPSTVEGEGWLPYDGVKWEYIKPTEVQRNPTNVTNIINYLQCSQDLPNDSFEPKDKLGNKINCVLSNGKTVREEKGNKIINNIVRMAYSDKENKIDISKYDIKNMYIQFEQLTAIKLRPGEGYTNLVPFSLMGTVAEVTYLYDNLYYEPWDHVQMDNGKWSTVWSKEKFSTEFRYAITGINDGCTQKENLFKNGKIIHLCNTDAAIYVGIFNGFYADNTIATGMKRHLTSDFEDAKKFLGNIKEDKNTGNIYINVEKTSVNNLLEKYYSNDTANVFSFYINPELGGGSCNEQARNALTEASKNGSTFISEITGPNSSKYKKVVETCLGENGKINSQCPLLAEESINKLGVKEWSGVDLCQPLNCDEILEQSPKIKGKFKATTPYNSDYLLEGNDFPAGEEYDYDRAIKYIFDNSSYLFNNFESKPATAKLFYGYYRQRQVAATCQALPTCAPDSKAQFKCNKDSNAADIGDFNHIVIADTNDEDCLKAGIAYNNLKKDSDGNIEFVSNGEYVDALSTDSVYASYYELYGMPVYCRESVSLDLPSNPETTKAGRLMKWGIDKKEIEKGEFGKMEVNKVCTFTTPITNAYNGKLHFSWINDINPKIGLYYTEVTPKDGKVYEPFKIEDSEIEAVGDKKDNPINVKYTYQNGSYTEKTIGDDYNDVKDVSCSGADNICLGLTELELTATYKLKYNDNLKWYSNKAGVPDNQREFYTSKEYEGDKLNLAKPASNYTLIGYGLPTSFKTPTNLSLNEGERYGYALGSEEGMGELSLHISHLGSKIDGDHYHFDNLIKFNVDDDTDQNDGTSEIIYSCGFKIDNEIFGYENCKENCGGDVDGPELTTPEGLDVVFRTVDLMDDNSTEQLDLAFPGRSGEGRYSEDYAENRVGRNWWKLKENGIYFILDSDIYTQEQPMYHMELTPSIISEIRSDNLKFKQDRTSFAKGYDPYSYMGSLNNVPTYVFMNTDNEYITNVFDKNDDGIVDANDYGSFSNFCEENPEENVCKVGLDSYVLSAYSKFMRTDDTKRYVASNFLSSLVEKGWLDGSCMETSSTLDRATKYYLAETNQCDPHREKKIKEWFNSD